MQYPNNPYRRQQAPDHFVAVVIIIAVILIAFSLWQSRHVPKVDSPNLFLGNPSAANGSRDNYLLVKPYFIVSYNNTKGEPNWVSWRLTKDDLGSAPRRNKFSTDQTLPAGFNLVSEKDYSNSGFDRGHMCPHGDRTKNIEMSYATFVMSNVVPQTKTLNEKAWDSLESYCRELTTREHDRVYIIDGPAGSGGTGTFGYKTTIAGGSVAVPAVCWKVIVAVPDVGTDDLSEVNTNTRVIAVIMPNADNIGYAWAKYRVSIEQVEQLTGYHFLTAIPPAVADVLRKKVDREPIEQEAPPEHFNERRPARETVPGDWN